MLVISFIRRAPCLGMLTLDKIRGRVILQVPQVALTELYPLPMQDGAHLVQVDSRVGLFSRCQACIGDYVVLVADQTFDQRGPSTADLLVQI